MIDNTSSATTAVTLNSKKKEAETITQHTLERLQLIVLNDATLRQCQFVYHDYLKFWQLVSGQYENHS
jgi:hypothetical protein